MARTLTDIQKELYRQFMHNETLAQAYGFTPSADFDEHFSRTSITRLLLNIVATAAWIVEQLFDAHIAEVEATIQTQKPHRLEWYCHKALNYQHGYALITDSDTYAEINPNSRIVRYASAHEAQGKLFLKVAKGQNHKEPLNSDEYSAFTAYMQQVKDAGVMLEIISLPADRIQATINIWYDPILVNSQGINLDSGTDLVRIAITNFVHNRIPFNGEFRPVDLLNEIRQVPGVVIPQLVTLKTIDQQAFIANGQWIDITVRHRPVSGYYKFYTDNDLVINYYPYYP